jgi:hypothetical protein
MSIDAVTTFGARTPVSTICRRIRLLNSSTDPQINTSDTATSAPTIRRRIPVVRPEDPRELLLSASGGGRRRETERRQQADNGRHGERDRRCECEHSQVELHGGR